MASDFKQQIPEAGYLRLEQIIGTAKAVTDTEKRPLKRERLVTYQPLIPVSRGTWFNGVRSGRFPAPVKLGPRITVWRVEDIRHLIEDGVHGVKPSLPSGVAKRGR
jgi:predicted DNA-binding transcriptional regulator AlpA